MDPVAVASSVLSSVVWALIGVLLLLAAVRIFDLMDPVPYRDLVKQGNVAAGIVLGGLLIAMSVIIFAAIR